jgi:hypothetical protein
MSLFIRREGHARVVLAVTEYIGDLVVGTEGYRDVQI